MLRRFDGILRDFADFFSESLNPNRLNPNQFADFCGFVAEFCGFLRNVADFAEFLRNFAEFCGITKPQSAKPQSLNSRKVMKAGFLCVEDLAHQLPQRQTQSSDDGEGHAWREASVLARRRPPLPVHSRAAE